MYNYVFVGQLFTTLLSKSPKVSRWIIFPNEYFSTCLSTDSVVKTCLKVVLLLTSSS
jgi:hypothetical protein